MDDLKRLKNFCLISLNIYYNRLYEIHQAKKYVVVSFPIFCVCVSLSRLALNSYQSLSFPLSDSKTDL